jgi:hypothetical protein
MKGRRSRHFLGDSHIPGSFQRFDTDLVCDVALTVLM